MIEIVERRLDETLNELRRVVSPLSPYLLMAAGNMLHAVLQGHRILTCGARERAHLSAHFARLMIGQFEHERPGLPTIAIQEFPGGSEPYAKAIRALGGHGDVLFGIARNGIEGLEAAIDAARERDMQLVLMTSGDPDEISATLSSQDSLICIESTRSAIVHEAQLMVIHTLCDLIDRQLLGLDNA